jgi:VCBS repeat-containing protein
MCRYRFTRLFFGLMAALAVLAMLVQPVAAQDKLPPGEGHPPDGPVQILAAGGPDAFGYFFTDSNEPTGPVYNFEDISVTGTPLNLSDDQMSGAIPVGFTFNYYGSGYTNVYVSSNGFISVLAGQSQGCCSGQPIPGNGDPNGIISAWWTDLYPPNGQIDYQTLGTAPNRRFLVQFTDVPVCCGTTDRQTHQYKFFEGSNNIEVHYLAAPNTSGRQVSAGIENQAGTAGLQYYFGTAGLTTPLAVRYYFRGYIAATWGDNSVHVLDYNLNNYYSFAAGDAQPNGIATDGNTIYTGHFTSQSVRAFDYAGNFLFSWSDPGLAGLQGLEMVNGDLVAYANGQARFYVPSTGAFIRSIPGQGDTVEGLAYDGRRLWMLGDSIIGVNPADGSVVTAIPNAAIGCPFGGTGLTANAGGQLTIGCADGSWYRVSSADGSVLASGNNGLQMYGLKYTIAMGPPTANDDAFITDEDTPFTTGSVLANDSDANDDPLTVDSYDGSGLLGLLAYNGDGTFDYDPNGQFEWMGPGDVAFETFTYVASDGYLTDTAVVSITINGLNEAPVIDILSVAPFSNTLAAQISLFDFELDPLSGMVAIADSQPIPLTVTFETLSTSCGGANPLQLQLNGGWVGETHAPGNCTCNPGIGAVNFTGPEIAANFIPFNTNTWTFNQPNAGPPITAWSRITVQYPGGGTQNACLFDLTGSGCTTTDLCAGNSAGPLSGSAALPSSATILVSDTYNNSMLPASLDTSAIPAGSYFLYADTTDGIDSDWDTEPITLTGEPRLLINPEAPVANNDQYPTFRLFATDANAINDVVELNPFNGLEINRFALPEPSSGGPDGLAYDGYSLWFINGFGTHTLYEIDPNTGTVRDADLITAGSGSYDGLAYNGGLVYILDFVYYDIHIFDPVSDTVIGTLDVNGLNGIGPYGALAGITGPNAVIFTGFDYNIHELDPVTGLITHSFTPLAPGSYYGAAVLNGQIYLANLAGQVEVYDRTGVLLRSFPLFSSFALGGDDIGGVFATDEETPFTTGSVLANDSDPNGDPLAVYSYDGSGLLGLLAYNGDGTFDYNPNGQLDWLATGESFFDVFTYVASDGYLTDTAVVSITIYGLNDTPVLGAIGDRSGDELTLISFTATATDPDLSDTLTFSLDVGAPAGAAIDPVSGAFTWTPTEAQGPGVYPVTVRVTDDGTPALDDFETIQITVNEVNNAPVLGAIGDRSGDELTLISFTATATDSDLSDTLTFSLDVGAPAGAAIDPASGAFTWTPTEAQGPGVYPVTVRVTDNGTPALDDFETIDITVNEANVAPTAAADTYTTTEDTVLTIAAPGVLDNDSDGDLPAQTLSAALDTPPADGILALAADGSFVYTPTLNFSGTVTFTYFANDGVENSTAALVSIIVTPVNDAPVPDAGEDVNAFEGELIQFNGSYTDPGMNLLAVTFTWDFGDGITVTGGLAPSHTYADDGVYTVTLTVDDGEGGVASDTLLATVENAAPELAPIANLSVTVGELFTVTASYTDPGLLDTQSALIDWGNGMTETVDLAAGLNGFDFSGSYDTAGVYTVTVTLTDDDGGVDVATFTVTVTETLYRVMLPLLKFSPVP